MSEMRAGDEPEPAVPTPTSRIQGLVVMLFGRGGFGKSSLLRHYRNIALEARQQGRQIAVGEVVDWEFAVADRRGFFNPPPGQAIDPVEYCKIVAGALAPKLGKKFDDCKHLKNALRDVTQAQQLAHAALEALKQDDRYGWLRGLAVESVTAVIRAHVPGSEPIIKPIIEGGAQLTQEQITRLIIHLRQRLKDAVSDYLAPATRLALALGQDVRDWARNHPLLICFDTYEEIDEGDAILRSVMGTAGPRVGWLITGRDNLWGGTDQIRRSIGFEYGYKELVPSDRGLAINFNAGDIGAFTITDIRDYFDLVCEHGRERDQSLPPVTLDDARRIWTVTEGIPLAVSIAAAIYREKGAIDAVTERVDGRQKIIDDMMQRYLLHTRDNLSERHKLYSLAMLRRPDQPSAIAAALDLTGADISTHYDVELSRLHRRYSFIFTEKNIPSLHQEVRDFLRLWLLEHRKEPAIAAVNQRLLTAQKTAFEQLEKLRNFASLKERLQDDEWVGAYLDLAEQHYWSDPVTGLNHLLPFMIAAAVYRRTANEDAAKTGNFFQSKLHNPYKERWQWASDGLIKDSTFFGSIIRSSTSPETLYVLEQLERLATQRYFVFPSPLPGYEDELIAILWWRLGMVYDDEDDYKVIKLNEKALTILPEETGLRKDAAWTYFVVACLLEKKYKYNEAVNLLTKSIELAPDNYSVNINYYNRGCDYYDLKDYAHALEDFTYAISLDTDDAKAYFYRGLTYYDLKDYAHALEDFTHVLALRPNYVIAYYNRGLAYYCLNNHALALEDYTHAISLDTGDTRFYYSRGMAHLRIRKPLQASADFKRAYELNSNGINSSWAIL